MVDIGKNGTISITTVDGINPANQLRLVVYPIICDGFYTSQVVHDFFHQQYHPFCTED